MNKRILSAIFVTGLIIVFCALFAKKDESAPIVFTEASSLGKLTIDEKIKSSDLILIGEVESVLPSKWKHHNQKDTKDALPQEIFDAEGLFTDAVILIEQAIKGDYDGSTIRVRSFTGEAEQVHWVNSSEPSFTKKQKYLLFLVKDIGPSSVVDPGDYVSVNSNTAVYEIVDGKALSADDEWILEDLIAYIENSLSDQTSPVDVIVETPVTLIDTPTLMPIPSETLIETPIPADIPTTAP